MKILRNALISLSVLLVATALAAPGVIGPKVEEIWKQQLPRLNGGETTEYQRGWFSAKTRSRVQTEGGPTELDSEIQHGPLLFTRRGPRLGLVYSKTTLNMQQLSPELRAQLEHYYAPSGGPLEQSPLLLESIVHADDRVTNYLQLAAIEDADFSFDGLQLLLETDHQGSLLSGSLELGAFSRMQQGRETLYLAPARGHFRLSPQGSGDISLTLPLLRSDADSGPLELRDVSLNYSAELLAPGEFKISTALNAPQIQSATPISSMQQQMLLPRVSAEDLQHLLNTLVLTPAGSRSWPQVMARPLQLQQMLSIESANGPAQLDLDLKWSGMPTAGQQNWLSPLSGTLNLRAAEQALLQSPLIGQAMTLRQFGLLEESNGEVRLNLQLSQGQLRVNGQQLPPELFMLALMGNF